MLAEAPLWLASASGRAGRPPGLTGAVESGDRLRSDPAGHSGYRPASFFRPAPARQMAPPTTIASPVRKKSGWKGWNSFFRRRKANSDSSSDEAAAAARRRETACVSSPPPRSPISCYQRQRPVGSTESLDGLRGLSSGGSEAIAGGARRNRRSAVKARVEARRSNTASSEEEEPPLQRVSSQLSLPRDGSLSRRSRAARTERYNRRRSRDDLSLQREMMLERRRDEERLGPVQQRWAATVICRQAESGGSPGLRDPLYPGQSTAGPRLQPSYFAPAPRRTVPVTNGVNPQLVAPSSPPSLHPAAAQRDERYPLPIPAAAPALRSLPAASASAHLSESRRAQRPPPPPPPPPRDPRIKITVFPEPSPVSHSLDQLKAPSRCHTVTVRDIPSASGGTSSRSVPAQVSALRPRVKLSQCHLSGSDQSIAQYKQQLYDRHRSPGASHVYSCTDLAPTCTTDQLRSFSDRPPASAHSRYVSQDSAFLSDSQTPAAPPASASTQMPSANGATESWQRTAVEQRKVATDSAPPPPLPPMKPRFSPPRDSLASSQSEMSVPVSQNTSFSCHDSDSVLGRSRGERRPLSLVAERQPEPAMPPPPPRPASEQAQRRSENFEEALDELEAIYKSLRLDDEDLLDRAERRDLPTSHQELWRAPSAGQRPEESEEPDELNLNCTVSSEELSGGRWQSTSSLGSESRHRAPALRRSAVPNKQEDDVYTRRLKHNEKTPNSNLLCDVLSQGGSYLLVSPVLSPTASMDNVRSEPLVAGDRQPDLTLDDVTFRNNRHANAVKIIEPQPPFGIPLGPTCPAAASDYLHVTPPQGKTRATFRPRKNPDLVADDLAFRALRKDKNLIDTNALDALIRETDQIGKKRATRTLSDDLSMMVKAEAKQPSGRPVSLCVCGGHSVSDCELDREVVAARRLRPVQLRPRPESQRTYGLYDLYVGNLSEPETGGSRTSRSRTASITTSTETLTEMGQRAASGQFAAQVRPFLRVCSESEADSLSSVSRSRASTAPPSPVPVGSDAQLDSLLESLQLEEVPATGRRHRPPRLTATLHALADIDKAKIPPSAMAAPDSVADHRLPTAESILSVTEHNNTSPDTDKAAKESVPTSESLSTTSLVPLPSTERSEWPPLSAAIRPPAAGQEASVRRPPRPRPPSPEAADAAEAVRKEPLSSPDGMLLSSTSQISSARATPEGKSMTSGSDSERANEWMARYKEERRRQLAARTAHLRHSSSDEEEGRGTGSGRPKLRRRRGSREPRPPSDPTDGAAEPAAETLAGVRTTRASRLRAATSGQCSVGLVNRRTPRRSPEPSVGAHSTAASGRSDEDSRHDRQEKDKSHRRKSNLNRARGMEEVTSSEPGESTSSVHGCSPGAAEVAGDISGGERRRPPTGTVRPLRTHTPESASSGRAALRRTLDAGTNFIQRRPDSGGGGVGTELPRLDRREAANTGLLRRPGTGGSSRFRPESTPDGCDLQGAARGRTGRPRTEPTETSFTDGRSAPRPAAVQTPSSDAGLARRSDCRTAAGLHRNEFSRGVKTSSGATVKANSLKSCSQSAKQVRNKTEPTRTSSEASQRDKLSTTAASPSDSTPVKWSANNRKTSADQPEPTEQSDDLLPLDDKLKRLGGRGRVASCLSSRHSRVPTRVDADDISARIEKLTTLARATAVRVDRLAGPPIVGADSARRQRTDSTSGSSDGSDTKARRLASQFEAVVTAEGSKRDRAAPHRTSVNRDEPSAAADSAEAPVGPKGVSVAGPDRKRSAEDALNRFDSIAAAAMVDEDTATSGADDRQSTRGAAKTRTPSGEQATSGPICEKPNSETVSSGAADTVTQSSNQPASRDGPDASGSVTPAPLTEREACGSLAGETMDTVCSEALNRKEMIGIKANKPERPPPITNGRALAAAEAPTRPTQVIEEIVIVSAPKKVTGVAALRHALESRTVEQPPPAPRFSKVSSLVESRPPLAPSMEPSACVAPPHCGDGSAFPAPPTSPGLVRPGASGSRPPPVPTSGLPPSPISPDPVELPPSPSAAPPSCPDSPQRCASHPTQGDDLPPVPPVRSNSLGCGSARPPSILKQRKRSQEERLERGFSPESSRAGPRPILKKKQRSPDESEPRPILKKRPSTDDELETERERPRPILKNKSVEDVTGPQVDDDTLRPILKSSRSREEELDSGSEPPPSILKRRSLEEIMVLSGGGGGGGGGGAVPRRLEPTDERPPRPILRRPRRDSESRRDADPEAHAARGPLRPLSSPAMVSLSPARPADDSLQAALRASSPVPLAEAISPALPPTPAAPAPAATSAEPMTLEQKKSLFMEFESRSRQRAAHCRPRRYQRGGRLRAERSATQPITPGEVAAAAGLSAGGHQVAVQAAAAAGTVPERGAAPSAAAGAAVPSASAPVPAPTPAAPDPTRRPSLDGGALSFRETRQLMTRHGEELLQRADAARRPPLQPPSTPDPSDSLGILCTESAGASAVTFSQPPTETSAVKKVPNRPSRPSSPEESTRGILKPPSRPGSPDDRGRSILKPSSRPTSPEDKARGILKPSSRPTSPEDMSRGILKPSSRPSSPDDMSRGILKPSSRSTSPEDTGKGILKPPSRPTSPEDRSRGILKPPSRPTSPEDKARGILKPPSRPTSPDDRSRGILKPPSRPTSPEGRPAVRGILRPSSRACSPDGAAERRRLEDWSSEEEADCGVSLADQLFNLGPQHDTAPASQSGKTVEEIAADITRRSRASCGRRPRPATMVLQKSTEPLTSAEGDITPPEIRRTGGIKDRLAALQKSGDEGWRRRVRPEEPRRALGQATGSNHVVLRKKTSVASAASDRPVSHIERVSGALHMTAAEGWKTRVPENDASRFTVAGKMGQLTSPCASPALPRRQHNTPKAVVFRSKTGTRREAQSMYVGSSETTAQTSRATQPTGGYWEPGGDQARPASMVVSVPELADADFSAFFGSAPAAADSGVPAGTFDWDLDCVRRSAELAAPLSDRVRVQRRAHTSRNPVRALSERLDLRMEYEEVRLGVGEQHVKMAKVEELSRHSTFAQESLAGLAAKVDFSAVKLGGRKAAAGSFQPFRHEPMLLRVKGRRHVQTRLVQPNTQALNAGDCFVLVSKDEVFQWSGVFSNVIEQSKAADVALHVSRTHDLGCLAAAPSSIEYDSRSNLKTNRRAESRFFQLLGGRADVPEAGPPEEDEDHEAAVVATNKVYEVTSDEELVPVQEAWGQMPKYQLLQEDKVFVFDFGAELYLWTGKRATKHLRDAGRRLTGDLWEAGCDYSDCLMSPIEGAPLVGPRPTWGILGRVGQNMETILFREKFLDWNDPTRLIKVKSDSDTESTELAPALQLSPCDAAAMVASHHPEPDLLLEMEHLGRGTHYYDEEARRQLEISTVGVKTWHVNESAATPLDSESTGLLHQGDTYVIQWVYQVTQTGRRLGGGASKHLCVGRQRCAYFFWQGASSTVNEKGASALMVVELDQERGPQIRVPQGREPAAFLQLFSGHLAVLLGKREEEEEERRRTEDARLLVVRGELPSEAGLLEVECCPASLRARAALVLLLPRQARALLWLGAALPAHGRQVALAATEALRRPTRELTVRLSEGALLETVEIHQGAEPADFWSALGGQAGPLPLPDGGAVPCTPRLFHFSCGSGRFTWLPVSCFHCSADPERPCALPYTQRELYERQQPALLLLDAGDVVFVWQGWRPAADPEVGRADALAGAATYRWHEERRCALQTAVEYSELRGRLPCTLVAAGLEPVHFQHLFPAWRQFPEAAELNQKEGYSAGFQRPAQAVLSELTRSLYPLDTLRERPLPDGVDPVRLETYLSDEEFREVLQLDRAEFAALPTWKQKELKKEADLF